VRLSVSTVLRAAEELQQEQKRQQKEGEKVKVNSKVKADFECQLCQFVVGTVDAVIGEKRTEVSQRSKVKISVKYRGSQGILNPLSAALII
jgi:fructose-specific phosphotransferase system component IIB